MVMVHIDFKGVCGSLEMLWLRGASYYGRWIEKTLYKPSSRGQGRSPLKYRNYGLCISFERKVCLLKKSLGFG
jgi:hypothetical protein